MGKTMIPVSIKTKEILDVLTDGLTDENSSRKINNGAYMAVCVERLYESNGGEIFSIAHYGEQNGDAMRDPDVEFLKRNGEYFPLSFRQDYLGIYREFVRYNDDGKIIAVAKKWQYDCCEFCKTWMKNIKFQQKLSLKNITA
jgi:hypothetical protein